MNLLDLINKKKITCEIIENADPAEINFISSEKDINSSPLFRAIDKLNLVMLTKLFENEKVDLNIIAEKDRTLLNYAIERSNVEAVKLLINNPRFKLLNFKANPPLIQAFHLNSKHTKNILKLLLTNKNIDFSITGKDNDTALHLATLVDNESCELSRLILENKNFKQINAQTLEHGFTALHYSVAEIKPFLTEILIHYGADINIKDKYGSLLLHIAVKEGSVITTKLLLDLGADINEEGCFNVTALHIAVLTKNQKMLDLLLEYPNIDCKKTENRTGLTAFEIAIDRQYEKTKLKIAHYIVMQNAVKEGNESELLNNDAKLQYKINEIIWKNKLMHKYNAFLKQSDAKKILNNFNNCSLKEHYGFVSDQIKRMEPIIQLIKDSKPQEYEKKIYFLKKLKEYEKDLLSTNNKLDAGYEKSLNSDSKLNLGAKTNVKEEFSKSLQRVKEFRQQYFTDSFEEGGDVEKRLFFKKEKQIPRFQQPKERKINVSNKTKANVSSQPKNKSKSKIATQVAEQPNLLEIEAWEKTVQKQNLAGKSTSNKKGNPMDLIKNFPNLQESLISLNAIELDETKKWWDDIILNGSEEVINDLEAEITNKIKSYDKTERILTEAEFNFLQTINDKKSEKETIFPIIVLHRNDLQDHEKGRPAISLGIVPTTNLELVIPGTTRKIEYYDCYQYDLNGRETYFYLKNIIAVANDCNKGLWNQEANLKFSQNDIRKLLVKVDDYYQKSLKKNIASSEAQATVASNVAAPEEALVQDQGSVLRHSKSKQSSAIVKNQTQKQSSKDKGTSGITNAELKTKFQNLKLIQKQINDEQEKIKKLEAQKKLEQEKAAREEEAKISKKNEKQLRKMLEN